MTYRPGSTPSKIAAFYTANPHEWLTWEDIALKCGVTVKQAKLALADLRKSRDMPLEVVSVVRLKDKAP